ncbi:MAG: glutathione S-transferase family protein [Anaeromyxobacteraceae bacterium]
MRVRVALAEKDVPWESVDVDLARKPPRLLELNAPRGAVPVVEVDGAAIVESRTILEYLEDRHPERPLLPREALARARVRNVADRVDADLAPALGRWVHAAEADRVRLGEEVQAALRRFEALVPEDGFLCGAFSLADVCAAPLALRLPPALSPAALGLARLAAWLGRARARPSFASDASLRGT